MTKITNRLLIEIGKEVYVLVKQTLTKSEGGQKVNANTLPSKGTCQHKQAEEVSRAHKKV